MRISLSGDQVGQALGEYAVRLGLWPADEDVLVIEHRAETADGGAAVKLTYTYRREKKEPNE